MTYKRLNTLLLRNMPCVFWFGFVITLVFTLMPSENIPSIISFWDKLEHVLAFCLLTLTGAIAYQQHIKLVSYGLVFYGASIEVMQTYFTTSRNGDVLDLMADSLGVIVGIGFYFAIIRWVSILKT